MPAITLFTRNAQNVEFQGMLRGLECSQKKPFTLTFYGERSRIEKLAKDTNSIIVNDVDLQLR